MAVKYKEYKPNKYKQNSAVKDAKKNADYWNGQEYQDLQLEDFKDSKNTLKAWKQYNNLQAPGDFTNPHQQGWDGVIDKINNGQPFTYDVNGDALYQQYKDQYANLGKMASADVIGQAAAMTGGYGNSYAQTVGQQAYQGYLQQLTDKIPELYQLALSKYNSERDDLYRQHGMYTDLFNRDYGMHRDAVTDYKDDRSHLLDLAGTLHEIDVDNYTINRDNKVAEVDSHNTNLANQQDLAWKVYTYLSKTDYGKYMDQETLKKLAIEVANDNLYKEEQTRLAEADLQLARDKVSQSYTGNDDVVPDSESFINLWSGDDSKTDDSNTIDYSSWDYGMWHQFFSSIRNDPERGGQAEAEETLREFKEKGLIPEKYVGVADSAVRGGYKGH